MVTVTMATEVIFILLVVGALFGSLGLYGGREGIYVSLLGGSLHIGNLGYGDTEGWMGWGVVWACLIHNCPWMGGQVGWGLVFAAVCTV